MRSRNIEFVLGKCVWGGPNGYSADHQSRDPDEQGP